MAQPARIDRRAYAQMYGPTVGDRVRLGPGAVVGADGFGFVVSLVGSGFEAFVYIKEVIDLEREAEEAVGLVIQPDQFPDRLFAPPKKQELMPDGTNPVYDKEIHSEIFSQGTLMLRLVIQISMLSARSCSNSVRQPWPCVNRAKVTDRIVPNTPRDAEPTYGHLIAVTDGETIEIITEEHDW